MKPSRESLRVQLETALTREAHLQGELFDARTERNYWRTRCERLLDAALARRGEITSPVMEAIAPAKDLGLAGLFSGLAVSEIETQKTPHSAPGQAVSEVG
jgi:hypothetical protein